MKNLLIATAALASLGVASFAVAGGPDQTNSQVPQGGLYVGAAGGWGALTTSSHPDFFPNTTPLSHKYNGFAGRVDAGYLFNVGCNGLLGLELGYNYLPQTKYSGNLTVTTPVASTMTETGSINNQYTFDLLAVGKYYLTDQFNVFGKAGVAYVSQVTKANVTITSVGATPFVSAVNTKKTKFLPEVAVGAGYNITSNLEATVTYAHAFGDNINKGNFGSKVASYNTVLAGLDYTFNL